jgi:HlyD family secretion protein
MRKWTVRLVVLLALVAAIVVLKTTVLAPSPVPVRVVAAEKGRVESTVTNSKAGTVKARRRASISPEIGGRVVEIRFAKGDRVRRGDLIARLNDESYEARLEYARRSLEAARSAHEQAILRSERDLRELERNRKLAEDNVIPVDLLDEYQSQYDISRRACEAAEARIAEAEAQVSVAEAELRMTEIRAPFDGVLAELTVQLGEWITPSPPMLVAPTVIDLIDTSSLYVSAPMDEVDSAVIREDARARVTIDPFPGREFPGRVVRVAPFVLDIEEQNRTVEIEVELDDREFASTLLPGTSADVEILLDVRENVLRIPTSSLVAGNRVFAIEGDRIVERSVRIGLKNWESTEILEGLAPGDLVVTSLDRPEVKPGALVRIEKEDSPGP